MTLEVTNNFLKYYAISRGHKLVSNRNVEKNWTGDINTIITILRNTLGYLK